MIWSHFSQVLRDKEIDYIVAPFEADAQLAFLEKNKAIDGVITEDSDLLTFGCSRVNLSIQYFFFKIKILPTI